MTVQPKQLIEENLWWVIPGRLAGVRKPTDEELVGLKNAGVGAISSVFHDSSNLNLYQQTGIPSIWLPIEIDSVPSQAQLQDFQNFVDHQNQLGHAVAVHCSTGRHRTGTILAAYLIRTGSSYEHAIKTILTANPNIELPESQSNFLQTLAKGEELA